MIPCIDSLRLNLYKPVKVPSTADLYSRYGERVSNPTVEGVTARFNASKLDGYAEAQKVVDKYLFDEQEAYEAQQAEIDRLRLESEELKSLKDSNV